VPPAFPPRGQHLPAAALGNLTLAQDYLDDCQNLYTCQANLDHADEGRFRWALQDIMAEEMTRDSEFRRAQTVWGGAAEN